MNTSILIVEDDFEMAELTAMLLESEGYQCKICTDGEEAIAQARVHTPNVILLDLMLPGKSGLEICKELRCFYQGAVIVLTGQDNDISEVALLKAGADDYILKPLKPLVLIARISSILRRLNEVNKEVGRCLSVSGLNIFPDQRIVTLSSGQVLDLTSAEFDVLHLLAENAGSTVSRDQCSMLARGIECDAQDRSIDMRVSSLRKKLSTTLIGDSIIVTVRNKGYMLAKT